MPNTINDLLKSEKFNTDLDFLYMLKYRWLEEFKYEDFNDYISSAKKNVESIDIESLTKRFEVGFSFNGNKLKLKLYAAKWKITYA